MTKKIHALGAAVIAGAVALTGAATADVKSKNMVKCDFRPLKKLGLPGPALVEQVPGTMTPMPLNSVRITDKNIAKKILPQAVFSRRTQTGTVEVMARLVNCTDYPQEVLVRTSFMDINQMPAEPTSAWQRVFLQPRSQNVYSEKSMMLDIGYFLIEVDEGD
jgi:hypothetical protein